MAEVHDSDGVTTLKMTIAEIALVYSQARSYKCCEIIKQHTSNGTVRLDKDALQALSSAFAADDPGRIPDLCRNPVVRGLLAYLHRNA